MNEERAYRPKPYAIDPSVQVQATQAPVAPAAATAADAATQNAPTGNAVAAENAAIGENALNDCEPRQGVPAPAGNAAMTNVPAWNAATGENAAMRGAPAPDNRTLYRKTFSHLHTLRTLDMEAIHMKGTKRTMTGPRCRRALLVTTLILIMILAMAGIGYAATGGDGQTGLVQTIRGWIVSEGQSPEDAIEASLDTNWNEDADIVTYQAQDGEGGTYTIQVDRNQTDVKLDRAGDGTLVVQLHDPGTLGADEFTGESKDAAGDAGPEVPSDDEAADGEAAQTPGNEAAGGAGAEE